MECICRIIFLCGSQLNPDWVIRVLKGIVLVECWLTWLIVFVQRGKEELREATALLTAQQTSLEIIVNMCCSDGEWCGHGQPCWPQALFIKYISYDTVTNYVFVYRRNCYSKKCTQRSHLRTLKKKKSSLLISLINSLCVHMFRPFWWRVGGGIKQWWKWHGSRWSLWWSVQSDVSIVLVSWSSWGFDQPQHTTKGKWQSDSSVTSQPVHHQSFDALVNVVKLSF